MAQADPARSSTHDRDSFMADHQFHSARLESASTSAEEISSSTEKLDQVLHHPTVSEPIDSSPVWEGWTPLKIISSSSCSTHPPLVMQDQTTSHSTMSSETYNHHHHHPDSLILSANWNITSSSSMVSQPAPISGSAMPCYNMDQNMKHPPNTTTGSSSSSPSFGTLMSPTRLPPSTDHNNAGPTRFDPGSSASSEHSSFIFSELMRSMRNNVDVNPVTSRAEGSTTSRHHQDILHPAADGGNSDAYKYDQGKSYEEEGSLQFSNFGAPSKVTGTESPASDQGKSYDEGGSLQFPSFGGSKAIGADSAVSDQGKSYEEQGSLQFSSFGGSKIVGTDSAANPHHQNLVLQLPISPESPISPLDLNNVVQHRHQQQQQQQQQLISVKDQTLSIHPAGEAWPASSNSIGQQELSEGLHHFSRHRGEAAYSNQFYNGNNNSTSTLAMRFSLEGHHHHHHPSPDLESSPSFHLDEFPAQRSSSKLGRRSLDTEVMMNNIPLPSSVLQSLSPVPWSQLISSSDMIMSHGVNNSTLPNITGTDRNVQYQTFSGMTCTSNSSSARGKSKMGHIAHGINPVGSVKGARMESSSMSGNKRSCFEINKKPAQAAKDKVSLPNSVRIDLIFQ